MHELSLLCPEDSVEQMSDALEALSALSVSVEDADAQTQDERAIFGEPGMPAPRQAWMRSRVLALFADEALANEAASVLAAQDFFAGCQILGCAVVDDQDWVRLTQSQFTPVEVTPTFWIVPTWHEVPAAALTVIRLDPGLAFGTGTHPTTRMCLRWMAARQQAGGSLGRVLDYGCGSGILAIGAGKLGALDIDAVDIDPSAIEATVLNAQANGVQLHAGMAEQAVGLYQTVLANILATPLKVLAPLLCSHVAVAGSLVLAGILERQAEELTLAYAPYCRLAVMDSEDGWILMTASL
jgi:ribosomal protein L11 methyltransferase